MTMKIENEAGEEIEVYTAEEVTARETAAREAAVGEYKPKLDEVTGKLSEAEKRAAERAGEFKEFRKLREEDVAKLSEAERTIYENGLRLKEADDARVKDAADRQTAAVTAAIKAKAGDNAKLAEKMTELWPLFGIEANTPEQIEAKTMMVLGAISTTTPDLVASVNGFGGGSYAPPAPAVKEGESFADTDAGKAAAAELGLVLEAPKA